MRALHRKLLRDLKLASRRRIDSLLPVVFFIVALSLFPLGVGPEPSQIIKDVPATADLVKLA